MKSKHTQKYAEKMAMENLPKSELGFVKGGLYYIDGYMSSVEQNKCKEVLSLLKKTNEVLTSNYTKTDIANLNAKISLIINELSK
jgi:hypothetical protein